MADWLAPPRLPVLLPESVHIWRVALEAWAAHETPLAALLAPDEQQRAARLRYAHHRKHYIIGRGLLRRLLAAYTGLPAARVQLAYGPRGKPALAADQPGADDVSFNLAHSHGLALYAFGWQRALGVDIEHIRDDVACLDLAARFFAPGEYRALAALPGNGQRAAFFAAWTRKEAYIKAHGAGLALALRSFEVAVSPDVPPGLLATHDDPAAAARWQLCVLEPGAGFAAALALERRAAPPQLHMFALEPAHAAALLPQ